ncbi:MAG: PSD1 and planctomycete cytochrome C domain-containing protein [Rubripirellula sp.]|nr:PSD1 and planctomycete cytochrome C domain-containing protein [Rubripirellula sp.]
MNQQARFVIFAFALSSFCPLTGLAQSGDSSVSFNRDIRSILSDRCFQCHGPDENERAAELRLDRADGAEGAHRTVDGSTAIKPGSLESSEVWKRIITADLDELMPPPEANKKPLTDVEKNLIKSWIEAGAKYEDFWAFEAPKPPRRPSVSDQGWSNQAIDQYVLRRLEREALHPKPRADRRTLIRRLTLDLTGLPPTRKEITQFLADDQPNAYERLVDRLLERPQFGEHIARYWLDLVRFADTNGIHHDHFRDQSPYRDWVIRAFNQNLPYDEFVRYQLAGDLFPEATQEQLVASGFHRLHRIIDRGTMLPEESQARNVIDRVTAVSTSFMGLTVQCAVCHDHKYDPITSRDFYQLYAFFNNIDANPETGGRSGSDFKKGLQPPYISLATLDQEATATQLQQAESMAKMQVDDLKKRIKELDQKEADKEKAEQEKVVLQQKLKEAEDLLTNAKSERSSFELTLPAAMVMKERTETRPSHIMIRGDYANLGEQVTRQTPAFLPPLQPEDAELATRMDLANWFVRREHPLTARVAVNRFWQQLFGVGIVKTSEDLGTQGEWPSHPELLDYLAWTFVENGWDVKALFKEMALSETYCQVSDATPEEFGSDPENRLLSRASRYRLDSEVIRDQILATSGLLVSEMYGKSVKPPQPAGLWKAVALPSSYPNVFTADTGDKIRRRSVYTFWKRGLPPPQMTILNAPTREECIARRERTNTPLQALLLLNEQEYLKAARQLASNILQEDPEKRLSVLYETVTAQVPDATEAAVLEKTLNDLQVLYRGVPELSSQLTEGASLEGTSAEELAAWTVLVNTLYNLDITKTRQ